MPPTHDNELAAQVLAKSEVDHASWASEQLADLIEQDPKAVEALRKLILEGLESGEEGEVNDEWWLSLADGIRARATARRA